ncbi:hypothetical protein BH11ACT2_BH11ACT2_05360 [soil metagenome]
MSQDDLFGAPAGWYPDPLGLPQLRWWNNHAWTEQTSAARQPMVVQDTKFAWADEELPSRRQEREREREQQRGDRTPLDDVAPTVDSLRELEPPRAFAKIEQDAPEGAPIDSAVDEAAETVTSTPGENKWWSAPKAAEDRRAAAASRQAAAAQAAAIRAAAAQAAAQQAAADQAAAAAEAAVPAAEVPVADLFSSHYFSTAATDSTTPAAESAPTPAPAAEEPVSISDIFGSHYFSTLSAPVAPAQSFTSRFDTTAPLAPADEALDDIFGAETSTRRGARARRPIISPDLADRSNPIVVRDKVSSSTGTSWVIAMLPLAQLVVGLLLVTSLGGSTNLTGAFVGIIVVPYFIAVALAYLDYRALLRAGNEYPAHWAWAFATAPIYLILRARATLRETGHGIGPILVWLALGVLQLVSIVAIPGILIAAAPTVFAQQIEQSVELQAATIAASTMTVDCAGIPPVVAGQEITCSTETNGNKSNVVVALQRANGWISWQVIDWGPYAINS